MKWRKGGSGSLGRAMVGRKSLILFFCWLSVVFLIHGCAAPGKYSQDPGLFGYTQKGWASYYAMTFQFRTTASGERLNNFSMSAAHRNLPFGTKVRVTNLRNGKHVTVRINDRGPCIRGRIIDLTRGAFARIDDLKRGFAEVEITVVP